MLLQKQLCLPELFLDFGFAGGFEGTCHLVTIFTRTNAPRQPWGIPRILEGPSYNAVRTPLAEASLGNISPNTYDKY